MRIMLRINLLSCRRRVINTVPQGGITLYGGTDHDNENEPERNHAKALCVMGACCTALYALMIPLTDPVPAITVLFLFSASIAGVNPMSTGMTGRNMNPESMGILLPIAACGGILMPAVIGFAANWFGLQTGMLTNLVPCLGIMILGGVLRKNERKAETA